MYVAVVPNRSSRPAILLRESYRDGDKVKNRTLANLSDWPKEQIETLRAALRGDKLVPAGEGMEIVRALPHGHVAAALGMARQIELDELLPDGSERQRNLALALIVERLIDPAAKLATACALDGRQFPGSDAWVGRGHRQGSLRRARLVGPGAVFDQGRLGAAASARRNHGA